MKRACLLLFLTALFSCRAFAQGDAIYQVKKGTVRFHSEAPQELISAQSTALSGVIDLTRKTFLFRIPISSFQGFNSPLQREHFNENYLETAHYPEASFSGKIIEDADFASDGVYELRAKGRLNIHGLQAERIIHTTVTVKNHRPSIAAVFVVALADHNIRIPRLVSEKLAPDISVTVNAELSLRP